MQHGLGLRLQLQLALEMRPGGQPTDAARYCQRSSHCPCCRSTVRCRSAYLQGSKGSETGRGRQLWGLGGRRCCSMLMWHAHVLLLLPILAAAGCC